MGKASDDWMTREEELDILDLLFWDREEEDTKQEDDKGEE